MELPYIAACWLLGLTLVGAGDGPWWVAGLCSALLVPVTLRAMPGRRGLATGLMGIAAALLAGGRFAAWDERALPPLVAEVGRALTVEGVVAGDAAPGLTVTRYVVEIDTAIPDGEPPHPTRGKLLVALHQYAEHLPGDRLRLTGVIELPPVLEEFDYAGLLLRRGIVGTMFRPRVELISEGTGVRHALAAARLRVDHALQRALPEPEAALAGGIAAGRDQGLPDEVSEDFRDAGLAHLLAVSGSNIVILVSFALIVTSRLLPRGFAELAAAAVGLAYLGLAGTAEPVARAAIMVAILLGGRYLGRPRSGLSALGLAVIVLTALDPGAAAEAGFQLSASATAGVIAFVPWIESGLRQLVRRGSIPGFVPDVLIESAALTTGATLATTPIVWATFGRISPLAPLANVVAAPTFAVAFLLSLACGLAGAVWAPAGWLVGLAAYYPLAALRLVAEGTSGIPGASIGVAPLDAQAAGLLGAALAALAWAAYRIRPPAVVYRPRGASGSLRWGQAAVLFAGLAPFVLYHSLAPLGGPGELVVAFLDVGQGDAILLTTPAGERVLVDGGPSGLRVAQELGQTLPHWARTIDLVILTHPQEDHVAGLVEVLRRFHVRQVRDAGSNNPTTSHDLYLERAERRQPVAAGDHWKIDGVLFEVLSPPRGAAPASLNDASLVLLVTFGETRFLLTGDAEGGPLGVVAQAAGRVDVLKVPHHGSKTTPAAFFGAVRPTLAVISAGERNPFGHPAAETLAALGGLTTTLRTDQNGRVEVRSDGTRLRVFTQR